MICLKVDDECRKEAKKQLNLGRRRSNAGQKNGRRIKQLRKIQEGKGERTNM